MPQGTFAGTPSRATLLALSEPSPAIRYQARYCEENVWHLCAHPIVASAEARVVVVSNADGAVAMWDQKAARPGQPIAWDYHVFVIARTASSTGWQVWDLDTRLGAPVEVNEYLDASFLTVGRQPRWFDPTFRVVPADEYRQLFSSDRQHMRKPGGGWQAPPPAWPVIGPPDRPSNLRRWRDMRDPFVGDIVNLSELRDLFRSW